MMSQTDAATVETDGEQNGDGEPERITDVQGLADHFGELPEPSEDPTIRYIHPGKEYQVIGGGQFTITAWYPDALPSVDGVVEFQMDGDAIAQSEHERDGAGVSSDALEPFEPEDAGRGVMTVTGFMNDIRNIKIGEADAYSYSDLYWNHMDAVEQGDA